MDNNFLQICQDAVPGFLGLFDFSIAPKLLFYAYIPTMLIALVFSVITVFRDKFSRLSISFFVVALFFSLWLGNEIVQWTAVYHSTILGSWKLSIIFESFFFAGLIFVATYLVKDSRFLNRFKVLNLALPIATLFLINSPYNIASYDSVNCEGVPGAMWAAFYAIQVLILVIVSVIAYNSLHRTRTEENSYRGRVLAGVITLFVVFLIVNIISEYTGTYTLNIVIPLGMVVCIVLFALSAVEHKVFSFKFYRSEVLIYSAVALVGSILLIPDPASQKIVIGGTLAALILLGRSITAINKREAHQNLKLDILNKRLTALDASKNEFLSFATHQLRSPLTSIKWGLGSLKENYSAETAKHLESTTDDLIGTVNDLLDISKIEQGGMVMKTDEFDVHDFVGRLVEEFRMTAESKGLKIAFHGDNVPCFIAADQNKLRQVFVNLIDNAIKYTKTGEVNVTFRKIGREAVIEVKDTGPGIEPAELSELFDKFLRGKAGKESQGGSGLGLYLAKKIVQAHNGNVSAHSEGVGKGSVFRVVLPLKS